MQRVNSGAMVITRKQSAVIITVVKRLWIERYGTGTSKFDLLCGGCEFGRRRWGELLSIVDTVQYMMRSISVAVAYGKQKPSTLMKPLSTSRSRT